MHRFAPPFLLVFLVACGGGEPVAGGPGRELYLSQKCVQCHGENREGTEFAPALAGLDRHWTRDELVEYLVDPYVYIERRERLRAYTSRFPMVMPRFGRLPEGDRRRLADYLLDSPQ